MNGITETKEQSTYFYTYDIEKEVFTQERSDRKLTMPIKDRQGVRDYTGKKVFCQLSEGKVKTFNSKGFYWENLQLLLVRIKKQKLTVTGGCCSKR